MSVADNGIVYCIKVRRNARVKKTNHFLKNLSVIFQKKNNLRVEGQQRKLWKEEVDCRNRVLLYKENIWRVCLFCYIKEHDTKEMMSKAPLYNKMISI